MSVPEPIQKAIIDRLRGSLPPKSALVDELSGVLGISADSAYRRIRCEKEFSVGELQKICAHFRLSFDALAGAAGGGVVFRNICLDDPGSGIRGYLQSVIADLEAIGSFEEKQIVYMSKDLPLMQLFQIPEVAAFKTFFWMKTMAGFPALANAKFGVDDLDEDIGRAGNRILELAVKIPTVEIWSEETIVSIIAQIRYYWQMGLFAEKDDALFLLSKLETLIGHVESEAANGFKYLCGGNAGGLQGNYKLYVNDLVLPDNTIYVKMGTREGVYLSHNVMNYLSTSDAGFCRKTGEMLNNLIRRSTLISQVAERERSVFFQRLKGKIRDLVSVIEQ